ncbi:MAG: ATP synthase F1 subunit gamma [Metamycoplasmataceae bacterium]
MASLQEVQNRITSVSTTRKITKAMELVSTSKLRKAKQNYEDVIAYSKRIEDIFHNLNTKIKDWNEIIKLDPSLPRVFIVVTSDLGLCGGYNNNIFKLFKKNVNKNDYVIILGSKGVRTLSKLIKPENILLKFSAVGDEPNYDIVMKITNKVSSLLFTNRIHSIHLIDTKYINSLTYEAEDRKIYPFSRRNKELLSKQNQINNLIEFEPDPKTVIKKALPLYLGAIIYSSMASSKVSEVSSRRIAMENASNNATDIIDYLEKEYNKERQARITQEITEIVAGVGNE